jgi:hypothetical protein
MIRKVYKSGNSNAVITLNPLFCDYLDIKQGDFVYQYYDEQEKAIVIRKVEDFE